MSPILEWSFGKYWLFTTTHAAVDQIIKPSKKTAEDPAGDKMCPGLTYGRLRSPFYKDWKLIYAAPNMIDALPLSRARRNGARSNLHVSLHPSMEDLGSLHPRPSPGCRLKCAGGREWGTVLLYLPTSRIAQGG
jgi:hypothetical protein